MPATTTRDRNAFVRKLERDSQRWAQSVDSLARAIRESEETPPALECRVEELRNKRDSVVTKVAALKRHTQSGWSAAWREFDEARKKLRRSWRAVLGAMDRERFFL